MSSKKHDKNVAPKISFSFLSFFSWLICSTSPGQRLDVFERQALMDRHGWGIIVPELAKRQMFYLHLGL